MVGVTYHILQISGWTTYNGCRKYQVSLQFVIIQVAYIYIYIYIYKPHI
jgi:hypothetical protein